MRVQLIRAAILGIVWTILLSTSSKLYAVAGTSIVATVGQPVNVSPNWPEGVGDIVNDPARTDGWNDWFSEWPSDVYHYAFRIEDTADVNRLIKKLAATKSELRQIRLSPMKEPRGLGWVTSLPEGNDMPVIFSIGDQERLDQWHGRLPGGKFGVMTFNATPIAVPPTLTIFVGNKAVDLEKLEIPEDIEVEMGDCPRVFHIWNTDLEAEQRKQKKHSIAASIESLDAVTRKIVDRITDYLEHRKRPE